MRKKKGDGLKPAPTRGDWETRTERPIDLPELLGERGK
jgi:hypothetical protein